jgi:general secretion pathway protein F
MPSFTYTAFNAGGASVKGDIDADSPQMAADILLSKGYIPDKVRLKKSDSETGWQTRLRKMTGAVPIQTLILFTKQFRSMPASPS